MDTSTLTARAPQTEFLRFGDLKRMGIVRNRPCLKRWQDELGFPRGFRIGLNTRVWHADQVYRWLAEREAASNEGAS